MSCISSCVTDLAKDCTKKLIKDYIIENYKYIRDYKANLENLQKQHEDLCNKKQHIGDQVENGELERLGKRTAEAKEWLRNAAGMMIDDEALKLLNDRFYRKAREEQSSSCGCLASPCDLYRRCRMSIKAKAKAGEIESIIKNPPSPPLIEPLKRADMKTMPTQFIQGLNSREELMEQVLVKLQDDQVHIVGLFGMGGLGKTTMAKEIFNKRAKKYFNEVMMVEISEAPNIERIQDQIAEQIDFKFGSVCTAGERAERLYNRLSMGKEQGGASNGKRSASTRLVILDNIWEGLDLHEVGIPHTEDDTNSCKLLLTTRERNVCRAMRANSENTLEVKLLDENEARFLFEKRLGKEIEGDHQGYEYVTKRLLNKCGGLPLAIVALADMLWDQDLAMWKHYADEMEKSISKQVIGGVMRETYAIVETSYKLMENNIKRFFLLACLFPLGSSICIEDLMRCGIGLGLFQDMNSFTEVEEQAIRWAQDLIASSLLIEENEQSVKIHDVIRTSAISIAAQQEKQTFMVEAIPRWTWDETCKTYSAITLMPGQDYSRLHGMKMNKLQILILKGSRRYALEQRKEIKFGDNFFDGMTMLKVLVVSNADFGGSLPESIKRLENLRTLHLEKCESLGDITLISELVNLIVLSLRGSYVKVIADGIRTLCKLQFLDLRECSEFPMIQSEVDVSRFTQLEVLYMDGTTSLRLKDLNHLGYLNVLQIYVRNLKQLPMDYDHQLLANLNKFRITVGAQYWRIRPFSRVLELWFIDMKLLVGYDWLWGLLRKSDYLSLTHISGLKNLVPELDDNDHDGFTNLKHLAIENCNDMKCLISSSTQMINSATLTFPMLEILHLSNSCSLKKICDNWPTQAEMMFLNLRKLKLESLKELTPYALPVHLARKLTKVRLAYCDSLKFIFMGSSIASPTVQCDDGVEAHQHFMDQLPCLRNLQLYSLPILQSINFSEANHSTTEDGDANCEPLCHALFNAKMRFPSLETLKIDNLQDIVKVWDMPICVQEIYFSTSFQNLKEVEIKGCEGLQSLGSPFVAAALVNLERLEISNCKTMTEVISTELAGESYPIGESPSNVVEFPKLTKLCLESLENLKYFYVGSYELQFPALKELALNMLPSMSIFAGSTNTTAMFSDKMRFPSLENMKIEELDRIEKVWDLAEPVQEIYISTSFHNLRVIKIRCCRGLKSLGPPSVVAALVHLECLDIISCETMVEVISTGEIASLVLSFPNLQSLGLYHINKLKWFYPGGCGLIFPSLKNMRLDGLPEFAWLDNSTALFNDKIKFTSLERLEVYDLNNGIEELWDMPRLSQEQVRNREESSNIYGFENLKLIRIASCGGLKSLGPPSLAGALVQLESLSITACSTMAEVIMENAGEYSIGESEIPSKVITFPKLQELCLRYLQNLKCFCAESYQLELPALKDLFLVKLPSKTRLAVSENSMALFSDKILQNLEKLHVESCEAEELCENQAVAIFNDEDEAASTSVYIMSKDVDLKDLPELKPIRNWHLFKNISCLKLDELRWEHVFSTNNLITKSGVEQLQLQLEELHILNCNEMEAVLIEADDGLDLKETSPPPPPSSEPLSPSPSSPLSSFSSLPFSSPSLPPSSPPLPSTVIEFPRLKLVVLDKLTALCSFSSRAQSTLWFPSLEQVKLRDCNKMETFWSGHVVAPKLSKIYLEYCPEMKLFSSGHHVLELPSLHFVQIDGCPKMESFSSGPLRASKLREVAMDDFPFLLKEKYDINDFLKPCDSSNGEDSQGDKDEEPEVSEEHNRSDDKSENNPPSLQEDDQQQQQQQEVPNHKVKFMVSYGGKIQPRSLDNQHPTYVDGETRILTVDRSVNYSSLLSKISSLIAEESSPSLTISSFKYQLPGEDLDALISVINDNDLEHMMEEYDRLYCHSSNSKPTRIRLFIFPAKPRKLDY